MIQCTRYFDAEGDGALLGGGPIAFFALCDVECITGEGESVKSPYQWWL